MWSFNYPSKTRKLSWANHITEITTKSSKVLAMTYHHNHGPLKRTLGPCKPEVKETAYNILLIWPKLEYASPMWNPHTNSQINHLKRIQHYAARFVANDHRRTVTSEEQVQLSVWARPRFCFLFGCRTKINHQRHHVATKYEMSRIWTSYASSATDRGITCLSGC